MSEVAGEKNTIYVRTLGSFSVSYNGTEIAIGSRDESQIGLLMFLIAFYLQTLVLMSGWADSAGRQTGRIELRMQENEKALRIFCDNYDNEKKVSWRFFPGIWRKIRSRKVYSFWMMPADCCLFWN